MKKLFVICYLLFVIFVGTFDAHCASNVPTGDIGDFGTWATENNRVLFVNDLKTDIANFQKSFQTTVKTSDYIPIEARIGRALLGGFSMISDILENSLVDFIKIFMTVLLMFWIGFESYRIARGDKKIKDAFEGIVKKIVIFTIWILILNNKPAEIFMWIMGPVAAFGSILSDLILNAVSGVSGAELPDTCAAITQYVANNQTGTLIDTNSATSLLCLTTRLSGFFWSAVSVGWHWIWIGIGTSALTFIVGVIFVVMFLYNIWKFAIMALGVMVNMFLTIALLPFTALAETFAGKEGATDYKGYAGQIYNKFLELFNSGEFTLSKQIARFVNACIYFVSLSIVIAICAALLSAVNPNNLATTIPGIDNDGFMITLIIGCLVAYLATSARKIAENIGGKIDDAFEKQIGGNVKTFITNTSKNVTGWYKAFKKK